MKIFPSILCTVLQESTAVLQTSTRLPSTLLMTEDLSRLIRLLEVLDLLLGKFDVHGIWIHKLSVSMQHSHTGA